MNQTECPLAVADKEVACCCSLVKVLAGLKQTGLKQTGLKHMGLQRMEMQRMEVQRMEDTELVLQNTLQSSKFVLQDYQWRTPAEKD